MNKWFQKTRERFWTCLNKEATPPRPEKRSVCWLKPYSIKGCPRHWSILFEDMVILNTDFYRRDDVERLVGALNGAYNMGMARERSTQELDHVMRFLSSKQ